jgi:hypothetical protein
MPAQTKIQFRRGSSSEWAAGLDPLSQGEVGYDLTLKKIKIGDGSTLWDSLPWATIIGTDLVGTSGVNISYASSSGIATVSVTGLNSSYISDFAGAVSGLLPVKNIVAGTNIAVSGNDGTFTISSNGLDNDAVKDVIGSSISGVSGVAVSYDNSSKITTISLSDPTIQVSDITDFSEGVDDRVASLLTAGTGIGLNYNDNANSLQVSVTGIPTSLITNFASGVNTLIENAVSASIVGGSGIDIVYNSGTNTLSISSALTAGSGISLTHNSGNYTVSLSDPTVQLADVTDLSADARTFLLTPSSSNLNSLVTDETGSGALVFANNPTLSGITVNGTLTAAGDLTVGGNLTVQGTTTTVNSTTVEIGDNIIRVNTSGLSTGGLEVVDGASTRSLVWNSVNNRWEFTGGNVYTSGDFIANNLQVSSSGLVSNLNSDLLDGEHGSYYRNFNNLSGVPSPVISGSLTGDVTGSASVTLNSLGNGLLSISTDIAPNTIVDADISSSAAISVTKLASSGISLGSTTINLGGSSNIIAGLSAISGTGANSPTTLYYCVIDGGTP